MLEGRELAGPMLQYLTEDLFSWLKRLTRMEDDVCVGKWMLQIDWSTFLKRADIVRLDLESLAKKEGLERLFDETARNAVNPLFAFANDPLALLPEHPETTKRLQLFGLDVRIVHESDEVNLKAPFEKNLTSRILNLLEKRNGNLFPVRDTTGRTLGVDLADPVYVNRLYDLLFPFSIEGGTVEHYHEIAEKKLDQLKGKLKKQSARREQDRKVSKHGRVSMPILLHS